MASNNSKGLNVTMIKNDIRKNTMARVRSMRYAQALSLLVINRALGVGKMETFVKDAEDGYTRTFDGTGVDPKNPYDPAKKPYRLDKDNKPKIKKVSKEAKEKIKPKGK